MLAAQRAVWIIAVSELTGYLDFRRKRASQLFHYGRRIKGHESGSASLIAIFSQQKRFGGSSPLPLRNPLTNAAASSFEAAFMADENPRRFLRFRDA
jgi:hypothetical protein